MSAEAEIQEAVETTVQEQGVEQTTEKRQGYEQIDFASATPDQIEQRFNRLYKQVKTGQTRQAEYDRIFDEQRKVIAELSAGQQQIVQHLTTEKFAETESTLRQQAKEAFNAGDLDKYQEIQDKIIDIKAQKIVAQKMPKEKQEVRQNLGTPANNASELSRQALDDNEITSQDAQYLEAWAAETNERGETIRPWTVNPDPSDPDPDFVKAAMIADKFLKKNPSAPIQHVLAEVDRKMGVSKVQGQAVMGGNLTTPRKSATITLTPQQQNIAVRTKFAGPGKSDAEHMKAYAKQIETMKGTKR